MRPTIAEANAADLAAFDAGGGTPAFRDRLALTPARIAAMAQGLDDIAALPDPLGRALADWTRPNGLRIRRIATPIGVIGMIYESRPNVGADAAGALPEIRQRGDPARRVGEFPLRARDPCGTPGRVAAGRRARGGDCRSRRRPTAPMSARCWAVPG